MAEKSVILLGLILRDAVPDTGTVSVAEKSVILLGLILRDAVPDTGTVSVAEKSVILLGPDIDLGDLEDSSFQWLKSLLYCWDTKINSSVSPFYQFQWLKSLLYCWDLTLTLAILRILRFSG